jgi:predicted  nucleic acid-binding Zn-ribbon protein
MGETLEELKKQKEDIQILLSTLEEAYGDASITKEHYDEVKGKNQKKLDEINKKIIELDTHQAAQASEPAPGQAESAKKGSPSKPKGKPGRPRKQKSPVRTPAAEPSPAPSLPPVTPSAAPSMPAETASMPGQEGGGQTDYSGIPQPLTGVAGDDEPLGTSPDKAPGGARKFQAEPGTINYTAQEIKDMFSKIIKEIKPQGLEVAPRVDKLEVDLEKVRAYIEAMKDERSSGKENVQRMNEEMGELRSNVSTIDRKVGESEMKVSEINEAIGDLRPQRFVKSLQEEDKQIKLHDARLDKLDDLNSVILKKVGQIEEVLKKLGSLEKIVSFSKEAAKRLLEIENREKRINRIADKIDGIFMELNKRLDEFALYKAKQDTLDELSQEMMKTVDDVSTKVEKYASKDDLEVFRSTIEAEIANLRTEAGTSPEVQRLESQKSEIEGLVAMLDEQFKAGAIPEKEYKKTRAINQQRLQDIEGKIVAARGGAPEQSPGQWAAGAASPAQPPAVQGSGKPTPSPSAEAGIGSQAPSQNPAGPVPETGKPTGTPAKENAADMTKSPSLTQPGPETKPVPGQDAPLPAASGPVGATPSQTVQTKEEPQPAANPTGTAKPANPPARDAKGPEPPKDVVSSQTEPVPEGATPEEMEAELKKSHEDGLIGKEAMEKTKGLLGGAKRLFHRKKKDKSPNPNNKDE